MFKDVKLGDNLYSIEEGWGTVEAITDGDYPLIAQFKYRRISFTLEGKRFMSSRYPTLFWDEIKFEVPKKPSPNLEVDTPKKPLPNLEVDTKVLVWNGEYCEKIKRHFKGFDKGDKIVCFVNGETSWSSNGIVNEWNYWELAEDNTKDKK